MKFSKALNEYLELRTRGYSNSLSEEQYYQRLKRLEDIMDKIIDDPKERRDPASIKLIQK